MTLDELLETVTSSSEHDWFPMTCWGAGAGPSYRDRFAFYQMWEGGGPALRHDAHSEAAAYRPNLSVTMAWGLEAHEDFREPWSSGFSDARASSAYVDLFYNNALVFRAMYVVVDGGRAYLPLPRSRDDLVVAQPYVRLIRLLDRVGRHGSSEFDSYFSRAGLSAIDAPWPS